MMGNRTFIWLAASLFLFLMPNVQLQGQGIISEKNMAKLTKKSEKEAKNYQKSGYQAYESTEDLEILIRSYYSYKYSEQENGNRLYAVPISMSREKDLEEGVAVALLKSKHQTLGLMQLYFYSWINADERTDQEQKDQLIKAAEKAEPAIRAQFEQTDPIINFIFYKKMKRDYRVELRAVYDQELLKRVCREQIADHLESPRLFKGKDLNELLTFEK